MELSQGISIIVLQGTLKMFFVMYTYSPKMYISRRILLVMDLSKLIVGKDRGDLNPLRTKAHFKQKL